MSRTWTPGFYDGAGLVDFDAPPGSVPRLAATTLADADAEMHNRVRAWETLTPRDDDPRGPPTHVRTFLDGVDGSWLDVRGTEQALPLMRDKYGDQYSFVGLENLVRCYDAERHETRSNVVIARYPRAHQRALAASS
jgi:hypothetical protein